jgi:hypothetical protein
MFGKNIKKNFKEKITLLYNKLNSLPKDKVYHSFYGTLIFTLLAIVNPNIAIAIVWIAAFGKEILDKVSGLGEFDIFDIFATVTLPTVLHMIIKGVI